MTVVQLLHYILVAGLGSFDDGVLKSIYKLCSTPRFWFGIRLIQIWSVSGKGYKLSCGRAQVLVGLL
jgi:hypothetical protein